MTILDTRPEPAVIDGELTLGTIAPGRPVYLIPDNPWLPWANRTGGAAIGAWLAALVTLLLDNPLLLWAVATAITTTLLFAWVVAGHELFEKRPTRFKKAP